jgi:pantoate kinase
MFPARLAPRVHGPAWLPFPHAVGLHVGKISALLNKIISKIYRSPTHDNKIRVLNKFITGTGLESIKSSNHCREKGERISLFFVQEMSYLNSNASTI